MKRLILLVVSLGMLLAACGDGGEGEGRRRPRVVTAFYPLEFAAERVARGRADVSNLTPAGVEPHDLELTSGQIRKIREADLLVYLGRGFQPAVQELVPELENEVVDALDLGGPVSQDPHIWLDPVLMEQIVNRVADALSEVDDRNRARYAKNAEELVGDLRALDDSYQNGLSRCQRREFVTSHNSFGYLAARFNLEQIEISGIDPEQEPSARRLREVSELVRRRGITTIFFESLLPADLAETVARETGAKTAKLDPIENVPARGDYLSEMRANLGRLREALNCS